MLFEGGSGGVEQEDGWGEGDRLSKSVKKGAKGMCVGRSAAQLRILGRDGFRLLLRRALSDLRGLSLSLFLPLTQSAAEETAGPLWPTNWRPLPPTSLGLNMLSNGGPEV